MILARRAAVAAHPGKTHAHDLDRGVVNSRIVRLVNITGVCCLTAADYRRISVRQASV